MSEAERIAKWEIDFHIEVDCYPLGLNRFEAVKENE